ncbi:MAG: hypothetical protein B0D91_09280 [Oceanospirillales bacterium LUC14_002_19_P2]|nr:MAG: hypothetical protein B0D91_09280 [Oceanospirillales bacterium LUC14_002_19_P2]
MPDTQGASLFDELTRIGIHPDLARRMDKSQDPEHVATKKDLMIFQEMMLQMQFRNEKAMSDLREEVRSIASDVRDLRTDMHGEVNSLRAEMKMEIASVRSEMKTEIAAVRTEMHGLSRQFWITFGGLITTILSVFLVNWYFHALTG